MPPPSPTERAAERARAYRTRALGALAASLLAVNAAVWLWPDPRPSALPSGPAAPESGELLVLEPAQQTTQQAPEAAPPPPPDVLAPPVEVPDEVVVRELAAPPVATQTVIHPDPFATGLPEAIPGPPTAPPAPPPPPEPEVVRDPDRAPFPVGQVFPVWPEEAERADYRARVRAEVLVDPRGRVTEVRIVERVRIGRGDREEPVAELPFGMEEEAQRAARAYRFRPARQNGQAVSSYATITLSFGV